MASAEKMYVYNKRFIGIFDYIEYIDFHHGNTLPFTLSQNKKWTKNNSKLNLVPCSFVNAFLFCQTLLRQGRNILYLCIY